jgi:hypothetical protein
MLRVSEMSRAADVWLRPALSGLLHFDGPTFSNLKSIYES